MEYYLIINKNETLSLAGKWMELENMLSSISQVKKDKDQIFSHMWKIDPNTNISIIIYKDR
jgi:hypothetical protein